MLYASEAPEEQWRFETALQERLAAGGDLAAAYRAFQDFLVERHQFATHFGIRFPTMDAWRDAIARVKDCDDPGLRGRLSLSGEFHTGDPGAYSRDLAQAFVKTDIFAAGLLTLGSTSSSRWSARTRRRARGRRSTSSGSSSTSRTRTPCGSAGGAAGPRGRSRGSGPPP